MPLGKVTVTMGLSDKLRNNSANIWDRILDHPFVRGLGDGSLPLDRFRFFLRQDYLYLIEYGRVLGIAAAKAPDLNGMAKFGELMHAALNEEMELHRHYCAGFGINTQELERTPIEPGTASYTHFLTSVAYSGSITEITTSLLPCQWGYSEIGLHLAGTGDTSERNPYADWIRTYSTPEFVALADWLRAYLDQQSKGISREQLRNLNDIFRTSSRYEYLFWDMAYNMQRWPL